MTHPIGRIKKPQTVLRLIKWQFLSSFMKEPTVHKWLDDSSFYVSKGETGLTQNIYVGLHEFVDMGFLLHLLREEDMFIDIGANSGSYTILASKVCGASTIAIEASPDTFQRLRKNISLNALQGKTELVNLCVSDKTESLLFTKDLDTTNHIVTGESGSNQIVLQAVTLDSIINNVSPKLMKIDVEGWEFQVISGGAKTLADPNLSALIVEISGGGEKYGHYDKDIKDAICKYGFREYNYDPFERRLSRKDYGEFGSLNSIFIRDLELITERLKNAPYRYVHGVRI